MSTKTLVVVVVVVVVSCSYSCYGNTLSTCALSPFSVLFVLSTTLIDLDGRDDEDEDEDAGAGEDEVAVNSYNSHESSSDGKYTLTPL